jgi:hypothetical protein
VLITDIQLQYRMKVDFFTYNYKLLARN